MPAIRNLLSRLRQNLVAFATAIKLGAKLRQLLRLLVWTGTVAYFMFALLLLGLRYAVLPQIENYRGTIEQQISQAISRPVGIREIKAHWDGLNPVLSLSGFEIRDEQGRPALAFDHVETELSWATLGVLELRLARLELDAPDLVLRRDPTGHIFAAGLEITPKADDKTGFADWILQQNQVVIRNASIRWLDEQRGAPSLELKKLNFQLDNSGQRHRFGLTAEPPPHLAAKIDIRGNFKGAEIDALDAWKGEAYAELDYANLAGWRAWVDYPVALPHGNGALKIWLEFAKKQLVAAVADVKLVDVKLKVRSDLPELDLIEMRGRLSGRRLDNGIDAEVKQLTLSTRDGLKIQPTDLKLVWHNAAGRQPMNGAASANGLDLEALARLAAYLPLDESTRTRLANYAPKGKIFDLKLDWTATRQPIQSIQNAPAARSAQNAAQSAVAALLPSLGLGQGNSEAARIIPELDKWSIKGRFDGVGVTGAGPIPGIAGLNGKIEGNEKGGTLHLDSQRAAVELSTIFAEPRIDLEAFSADLEWKLAANGLNVNLQKAVFQNKDAAGEFSGNWHALAEGPGELELSGRLLRATGDAIWRYMPLAVGKSTRDWLRSSLVGGMASDANVKLKGDLRKFPFRGGKDGVFEVRGKFRDALLRYADNWPEISAIEGEVLFAGERMVISAKSGKMFNVRLHDVRAEIPDIESNDELLMLTGKASGPTPDFLKFIESSPVGDSIDHFTQEMVAEGNGELGIKMNLPLQHLDKAQIEGTYRFDANRLTVDKDLPPITEVQGQLRFSSSDLEAKGIRGNLFGAPLSVDIKTLGEGNVLVNASGEVTVATLRRQMAHPLLDHLSGSAKWNGSVRVKKKSAEVKITSNLVGLSSSLPVPLNKSTNEALAFSFERKNGTLEGDVAKPGSRVGAGDTVKVAAKPNTDLLEVSLGRGVRAQVIRRHDTEPPTITRGLVSLGDANASMPDKNVLLAVNLPQINLDFWRELFSERSSGAPSKPLPLPTLQFDVRAGEISLQDKSFHDVRLTGGRPESSSSTHIDLKSRELNGSFDWNSVGAGKLSGRIAQFAIPESSSTPASLQAKADAIIEQMPALDITVDQLSLKDRPLGSLRLAGENREGYWHSKIEAKNEDGSFEATGRWKPSTTEPATHVDFKLTAKSLEKLLVRIGYGDVIKRGSANVSGALSWNGAPLIIDYPSLNGNLKVDAAGGQFNKLEPGVGRLLGILSLQSLPRRITLDFRDIFSEGFAFDSINGHFGVSRGILETTGPDNLQIKGPSAKILMTGTVNLGSETQHLRVRVQPALGESIAVGAMLANPVAGAVAWVAQKLLKDPLDQVFAFEYAVTGSWADPKVDKLGTSSERSPKKKSDEVK